LEALEERLGIEGAAAQVAEGLPVGSQAPAFELSGLYGETLTLEALRAPGRPVMLLFTDPGCGPCNALLPEIGRWQQEHAEELTLSLISRGTAEENRAKMTEHGLQHVLLQQDWEVYEAYQGTGTPSAVVVLPDGTIGSPVVGGAEAISTLVAQAAERPDQLPVMQPTAQGEPCPNCGKSCRTSKVRAWG
jgi:methylamine dehydrogenase accessory protein MauD